MTGFICVQFAMLFSPVLNRGKRGPVWVNIPINFSSGEPDHEASAWRSANRAFLGHSIG
jgi:hypothetical protein